MANRVKLNRSRVEQLIKQHPAGKKARYWDTDLRDFFLRITPAGAATYCAWIDKKDFRVGSADVLTPEEARDLAREHLARIAKGGLNPKQLREQQAAQAAAAKVNTFRALAEAFMAAPEKKALRLRTRTQRRENLDRHILPAIGDKPIASLKRADVKQMVRDIQARAADGAGRDEEDRLPGARIANVCHGIVRAVFNWAMEEERTETNPGAFRKLFKDYPNKRSLMSDDAVRLAWAMLETEKAAKTPRGWASAVAIQLCFATLQRPIEVVSARHADIDTRKGLWRIPAGLTKTNEVYEVHLSPLACRLFKEAMARSASEWVFPKMEAEGHMARHDLSQRWGRLRDRHIKAANERGEASPLQGVALYDARRLGRTALVRRLGVAEDIAEACINHAPDRRMAVRYDVGDRSGLIRAAMHKWGTLLEDIIEGRERRQKTPLSAA